MYQLDQPLSIDKNDFSLLYFIYSVREILSMSFIVVILTYIKGIFYSLFEAVIFTHSFFK